MIVNLLVMVEVNIFNVYVDQIEYFCCYFFCCSEVCISVYLYNDCGIGVVSVELVVMVGVDWVEGCLFGNGECIGNVCLVILVMNFYSQGIDFEFCFEQMNWVVEVVENCNQIFVYLCYLWVGSLVYIVFFGFYQDVIKKGFDVCQSGDLWQMFYLFIDLQDIGCSYEVVICVNSQLGKSGSVWFIE